MLGGWSLRVCVSLHVPSHVTWTPNQTARQSSLVVCTPESGLRGMVSSSDLVIVLDSRFSSSNPARNFL